MFKFNFQSFNYNIWYVLEIFNDKIMPLICSKWKSNDTMIDHKSF